MVDFATSSGHWYALDGSPRYTVIGSKGQARPATLADARKLNLVPSVTTIIRCANAPALERWKAEQLLMAALTLPRYDGEVESAWLERVRTDSTEQARKAADRGTAIHGAIECFYRGRLFPPEYMQHVHGAHNEIWSFCGEQQWSSERSFAHPLGYGGKCDLHSAAWLLDVKTKEFAPGTAMKTWDEHAMQLAAYRRGLGIPEARCAIVYVSASHPGHCAFVELKPAELVRGLAMFDALLQYWQASTGHRPSFEKIAA